MDIKNLYSKFDLGVGTLKTKSTNFFKTKYFLILTTKMLTNQS